MPRMWKITFKEIDFIFQLRQKIQQEIELFKKFKIETHEFQIHVKFFFVSIDFIFFTKNNNFFILFNIIKTT